MGYYIAIRFLAIIRDSGFRLSALEIVTRCVTYSRETIVGPLPCVNGLVIARKHRQIVTISPIN